MRRTIFPAMIAGTLLLGGCAAGAGGNPLADILGSVLGGGVGTQSNTSQQFERAAVDACGRQASQYGRVSISGVQQTSRDTLRVTGRIDAGDRYDRQFTCTFRSDGRIIEFNMA